MNNSLPVVPNDNYIDEVLERFHEYNFDPLVHTKDGKTWIDKGQAITFLRQELLAYRTHLKEEMEIVICAAIRMPDGYIIRGHRHNNCIMTASSIPRYKGIHTHGDDQGFVTSLNRYVTRKQGYEIQKAAGIESVCKEGDRYLGGELYSEDLY